MAAEIPRDAAQAAIKDFGRDRVQAWANQESNPLLKTLAVEVIIAAGGSHAKK